jgi:hypothetical protein
MDDQELQELETISSAGWQSGVLNCAADFVHQFYEREIG